MEKVRFRNMQRVLLSRSLKEGGEGRLLGPEQQDEGKILAARGFGEIVEIEGPQSEVFLRLNKAGTEAATAHGSRGPAWT